MNYIWTCGKFHKTVPSREFYFLNLDTTIAEMIKEETDAEEFRERIQVEQGKYVHN